jgi:Pre-toxin TG/CHAT domain
MSKYIIPISVLVVTIFGISETAWADNCGSLSDCYGVIQNATITGGLIAVFIGLALDFTPIIGNIKGIIEVLTGYDAATDEKSEYWEKLLDTILPRNDNPEKAFNPPVEYNNKSTPNPLSKGAGKADDVAEGEDSCKLEDDSSNPLSPAEVPKSDISIMLLHPSSSDSVAKTILILAANPKDTSHLRLGEEVREIDAGLQRAKKRELFDLEQRWAVRVQDVYQSLLDFKPQIVHFSGHGTGDDGLVLEDETGKTQLVHTVALAGLFKLFASNIECVVLNACYSEVQAIAIAQHIPYVIGMNKAIGDKAAIKFATGFYCALGAGESVEFAYKLGCNVIQLDGIPEHLTPVLKKKQ